MRTPRGGYGVLPPPPDSVPTVREGCPHEWSDRGSPGDEIAAVLAAHRIQYHHRNIGGETAATLRYTSCEGCDWQGGHHDESGWETHLAAALAPLIAEREAKAWDRGHRTYQQLGPDDCRCAAYNESECGCGEYGTNVITPNPYRPTTPLTVDPRTTARDETRTP